VSTPLWNSSVSVLAAVRAFSPGRVGRTEAPGLSPRVVVDARASSAVVEPVGGRVALERIGGVSHVVLPVLIAVQTPSAHWVREDAALSSLPQPAADRDPHDERGSEDACGPFDLPSCGRQDAEHTKQDVAAR
jgi:hypothetical protein